MINSISLLGSTGSIGRQTLAVAEKLNIKINTITAGNNTELLKKQILAYKPVIAVSANESNYNDLVDWGKKNCPETEILCGEEGLIAAASYQDSDCLVSALVGFAGLVPTMRAIKNRKRIALANKETLVAAGELFMKEIEKYGNELIPVDSEHSAVYQCLKNERKSDVKSIILTASGGPFRNLSREELNHVTVEQTLNHPNWHMGNKITVDSATMMNKGFEVMEAKWLFNIAPEKIEVLIHPQSIIHSMVRYVDGSCIAQLGVPDMMIPIQYALTYPERKMCPAKHVDFTEIGTVSFEKPDYERFICLKLAYEAMKCGGTAPCVINAANEVAVKLFLNKMISFNNIGAIIQKTINKTGYSSYNCINDIIEADSNAREVARSFFNKEYK